MFSKYAEDGCVYNKYVFPLVSVPTTLSYFLIIIIVTDRSIAVNFPFWYASKIDKCHIYIILIAFFSLGIGSAIAYIALFDCGAEKVVCDDECLPSWFVYMLEFKILICLIWATLILVQMTFTVCKLEKKSKLMITDDNPNRVVNVRPAVVLTFLFVILWTPIAIERYILPLLTSYHDYTLYRGVALHCMFLNSCVNIFVYAGTKTHNRIAYKFMLTHWPWRWGAVRDIVRAHLARKMTSSFVTSRHSRKYSQPTDLRRSKLCSIDDGIQEKKQSVVLDVSFRVDENVDTRV